MSWIATSQITENVLQTTHAQQGVDTRFAQQAHIGSTRSSSTGRICTGAVTSSSNGVPYDSRALKMPFTRLMVARADSTTRAKWKSWRVSSTLTMSCEMSCVNPRLVGDLSKHVEHNSILSERSSAIHWMQRIRLFVILRSHQSHPHVLKG